MWNGANVCNSRRSLTHAEKRRFGCEQRLRYSRELGPDKFAIEIMAREPCLGIVSVLGPQCDEGAAYHDEPAQPIARHLRAAEEEPRPHVEGGQHQQRGRDAENHGGG